MLISEVKSAIELWPYILRCHAAGSLLADGVEALRVGKGVDTPVWTFRILGA